MMRAEFARFLRFCLVGLASTGVHMTVVLGLAELLHWPPTWANVTAFACANLFSYAFNSRWTFASSASKAAYPRFLAVSLVGLTLSWACVKLSLVLDLHYLIGVAGSVVIVSIVGYILNRLFVFRHH